MGAPAFSFHLPDRLNATAPPEYRGIRRDHVRLMVMDRITGPIVHDRFDRLDRFLRSGDLLVFNDSRVLPAVLRGKWERDGRVWETEVEIRLARRLSDRSWEAWVPEISLMAGDRLLFGERWTATVERPDKDAPFVVLVFSIGGRELLDRIWAFGEPIRYDYTARPWELDTYQTVYASSPGSVEPPSAGRPFSWELLFRLRRRGVQTAFLSLHTGLSYWGEDSPFDPGAHREAFRIPEATADKVNRTRESGRSVIAVGTTVVRALETMANGKGEVDAGEGWTSLHITAGYSLQSVDGLLTGFHEPEASHLDLLSAFTSPDRLREAYDAAVKEEYQWHEFGDMHLLW
ncbi:S-adenosylmethionine:tRNA ribosyltransferase-isomerase [Desmospora profundinema]|uniref:S-adenosylmethionine:tRNA ribosyltransferase-isomerase n=1 Tax=Desmospora profundinema TaxID=1571184 RepID=A0ABU1IKZ5_9BACL|nr:S-adenosylmethionine:tRNA ribosyltransferase-isomerase [Desmospora profundinema]MDR6224624.1 S-adenosylmethionine:tRNA ribosyltransferase-isomerase [Desmospora profundinema]